MFIIFACLQVDPDSRLWAVSNRLQSYIQGTLNPQETNFRIFMAPSTSAIVRGTACERGGGHVQNQNGAYPPGQLVFRP